MNPNAFSEMAVAHKRVFLRVDFNVPIEHGQVLDDRRIALSCDAIRSLADRGGRVILASHRGRLEAAGFDPAYSLAPCAARLREMLGKDVRLLDDCVGERVRDAILQMTDGDVVLLENLRFHSGEKKNDVGFAQQLAELADVYCHEAFGAAHNTDASLIQVPQLIRQKGGACVAGPLLVRELAEISRFRQPLRRPFVAVMGGSKVDTKLPAVQYLLKLADFVLVGGSMTYGFMQAQEKTIGQSLCGEKDIAAATAILAATRDSLGQLRLPADHYCAEELRRGISRTVQSSEITGNLMGLDIGPRTAREYVEIIRQAGTEFWNGPMGALEYPPFDAGTRLVAEAVTEATRRGAYTFIGGGESAMAVQQSGLLAEITHVSTGGGASLHYISGQDFESVKLLN